MERFAHTITYASIIFGLIAVSISAIDDDKITFERFDNDMAWPLLDFGDITLSMTHGVHCIDVVNHNDSSLIHQLHKAHCIALAQKIVDFFASSPNYTVPDQLCQDFRSIAFPGGRVRRGRWARWSWWGGRKKRAIPLIKPRRRSISHQQDDYYNTLATRNFEELLFREQKGEQLTPNEIKYMKEVNSPPFIHMAALGLYCKYEGYIGVVEDVIKEHASLDKNPN